MENIKKLRKFNDKIKMPKRLVIDNTSRIQNSKMELYKQNNPGIISESLPVNSSFFYKTVIGNVVINNKKFKACHKMVVILKKLGYDS